MKTNVLEQIKNRFILVIMLITLSMLLIACGAPAPSTNPDGSINVEVTLTDFRIESSLNTFEAGKTYRFTVTNNGAIAHEFAIAEPLEGGTVHGTDMDSMHGGLILAVEETDLTPGATVSVDATFSDHIPDKGLEFACHTDGHYEAGMQLPISVK